MGLGRGGGVRARCPVLTGHPRPQMEGWQGRGAPAAGRLDWGFGWPWVGAGSLGRDPSHPVSRAEELGAVLPLCLWPGGGPAATCRQSPVAKLWAGLEGPPGGLGPPRLGPPGSGKERHFLRSCSPEIHIRVDTLHFLFPKSSNCSSERWTQAALTAPGARGPSTLGTLPEEAPRPPPVPCGPPA